MLVQFNALALFVESYTNRHEHKDFLLQINSIDFLMEYKIGIAIDYESQRKHHRNRVAGYLIVHVIVFLIATITIYLIFNSGIDRFLVEFFSVFIVALRYYQLAMYVDVLNQRYRLINHYLDTSQEHLNSQRFISKRANFSRILDKANQIGTVNNKPRRQRTNIGFDKLQTLRRVCRSLYTACYTINSLFKWTMALCIFTDFVHFMFGVYYILNVLLGTEGTAALLIVPVARFFMVAYHVAFFVIDCGECSEEV